MTRTISIARRFCGPPDSGNGGYVCGRLAAFVEGPAIVRLQVPPPLETEMEVKAVNGRVEMTHGATVVAVARASEVALDVPAPPGYADAEAAARSYVGFRTHPFPTCFVCGPGRNEHDGLRIFPGRVPGTGIVACPWVPDASLADGGKVRREFLWAALDCPGAFSFKVEEGTAMLLGEMAAAIDGEVAAGERCVVIAWELARDGRRHYTGTAIFSEAGRRVACARAIWFEVPQKA